LFGADLVSAAAPAAGGGHHPPAVTPGSTGGAIVLPRPRRWTSRCRRGSEARAIGWGVLGAQLHQEYSDLYNIQIKG